MPVEEEFPEILTKYWMEYDEGCGGFNGDFDWNVLFKVQKESYRKI